MSANPQACNHSSLALLNKPSQAQVDQICLRHDKLSLAQPGARRAVFSRMDLTGLNLSHRNLMDVEFVQSVMIEVNLDGSLLDKSLFHSADLSGARLKNASLRHADLRGATLIGANLTGADLFAADLRQGFDAFDHDTPRVYGGSKDRASSQNVSMHRANLTRAKLSGILAVNADFSEAIMVQCKLKDATLIGTRFDGADMSGADLLGSDLTKASLKGAIVLNARLANTNLLGADLKGVIGFEVHAATYKDDLISRINGFESWVLTQGCEGFVSDFRHTDFTCLTSLKGRNLAALQARGAKFQSLNLQDIKLAGAQLEGADLSHCNLKGADLRGARLRGARLTGADLREARLGVIRLIDGSLLPTDLSDAQLEAANFSRADLSGAVFEQKDLDKAITKAAIV
jgi:uncharacterized protein YjbI with pentapeptide repeats